MTREQAIDFLINNPYKFAHMLGFTKLTPLHNGWIHDMVCGKTDETLQASRGTYKTTSVSIALALIIILLPNYRTMFMRKTDIDIKEVIKQVQKILLDAHTQYFVQSIYGVSLKLTVQSAMEISTNLSTDIKGTNQLIGMGMGSSLTGKHFDRIFTDDIVNINDRISKAERERTKIIYQELQNVKNRGGRIYNTGTPWHAEDCFSIMPEPKKFNCYNEEVKKIITEEELENIRSKMLPSLFAANYELQHIPSEDVLFTSPKYCDDEKIVYGGIMHVDSAFYGTDYTAWCVMKKIDGKYYVYGKMRRKHVEECYGEIIADYQKYQCKKMYNEDNADKGMVGKDLRKLGAIVILYHESMNKFLKIATYMKAVWDDLYFTSNTEKEFIDQILEYYEDAAHDDAPDSVSSAIRVLYNLTSKEYEPLFMKGVVNR